MRNCQTDIQSPQSSHHLLIWQHFSQFSQFSLNLKVLTPGAPGNTGGKTLLCCAVHIMSGRLNNINRISLTLCRAEIFSEVRALRDFGEFLSKTKLYFVSAGEKLTGIIYQPESLQGMRENLERILQFMAGKKIRMHQITSRERLPTNVNNPEQGCCREIWIANLGRNSMLTKSRRLNLVAI